MITQLNRLLLICLLVVGMANVGNATQFPCLAEEGGEMMMLNTKQGAQILLPVPEKFLGDKKQLLLPAMISITSANGKSPLFQAETNSLALSIPAKTLVKGEKYVVALNIGAYNYTTSFTW